MVSWVTLSVYGTFARINAFPLSAAGKVVWAVRVYETLIGLTVNLSISFITIRTVALSPMVSSSAKGISATLLEEARVLTLPINASLIISTFRVTLAAS